MSSSVPKKQTGNISFAQQVKERSDKLMNYFLICFFICGLILAPFYDTWLIAFGVGGLSLLAYYTVKAAFPDSTLYQYVLSLVLGIFMAQGIYQMHGLFEMHFSAFVASAILITYQNWKLQIPLVLFVVVHHTGLALLQNSGVQGVYFTQLNSVELTSFIIHIVLAALIFFICGLWAYLLKKYSKIQVEQTREVGRLERETQIHKERILNEEALKVAYQKAEQARLEEASAPLRGLCQVADLLAKAELLLAGYHQHARSSWRKKRHGSDDPNATALAS